jgi:hypothetical protein
VSLKNCIKRSKMRVFRRIYMRRRLASGEYEASWVQIPNRYIKKFGKVSYEMDVAKPNFYTFSDFSFSVVNNDGYFSGTENAMSFWYGYLTRYRTLVKVEAGYLDTDDTEYPTVSTLMIGIMTDDIKQNYDNSVELNARHISEVFNEIPAGRIAGLGSTQTASDIVTKIRDFTDSNGVYVFQKYISSGAWNISVTTNNYNMATSTSLEGLTCWELMSKLAEAENYVMYIARNGDFYFNSRSVVASTPAFTFAGIGESGQEYGHNIMKRLSIDDGISKVYNRIRVKMANDDTLTSYYTKQETWNWADSSSSFYYGVRTYEYENDWLNTAGASTIADNLYNEFRWPKLELEMDTKFVPQLNLNDRVGVSYRTRTAMGGDLWGYFDWGYGIWAAQAGFNIDISGSDYKITSISHDLNQFKSAVGIREI